MRSLDSEKFECIVCSSEVDPGVKKLFASHGFRVRSCRLKRFPHTMLGSFRLTKLEGWKQLFAWIADYRSAKIRLRQLISEIQPSIVHFNSLTLAPYTRVPRKMNIPNIVHVREPVINGLFGIRRRFLLRCLSRFADKVICICRDNQDRLFRNARNSSVIYNPVDFSKFDYRLNKEAARRSLGIPARSRVVLFAGGSVPEVKGLRPFLLSMSNLIEGIPDLIGLMPSFRFPPDPSKREMSFKRRIAKSLGIYQQSDSLFYLVQKNLLHTRIISCPFTYEMEKFLSASDVVCVPHIKPHFSRTVIEAAAMKKPVVASRIGGIEEVIEHRTTGLLVPPGETKDLVLSLYELLNDSRLCSRICENAFDQAQALFDSKSSGKAVEAIYIELLEGVRHV